MKKQIMEIMQEILSSGGIVTTLDVKNKHHLLYPDSTLNQKETSKYVNEIFEENDGIIYKKLISTFPSHFEYSVNTISPFTLIDKSNDSQKIEKSTQQKKILSATTVTSLKSMSLSDLLAFKNTHPNDYVAYKVGDYESGIVFDTDDKFIARKEYKKLGIHHDDVRMIKVKNIVKWL